MAHFFQKPTWVAISWRTPRIALLSTKKNALLFHPDKEAGSKAEGSYIKHTRRPKCPGRLYFHRQAYGVKWDSKVWVELASLVSVAMLLYPSWSIQILWSISNHFLIHTLGNSVLLYFNFSTSLFRHTGSVKLLILAKSNILCLYKIVAVEEKYAPCWLVSHLKFMTMNIEWVLHLPGNHTQCCKSIMISEYLPLSQIHHISSPNLTLYWGPRFLFYWNQK